MSKATMEFKKGDRVTHYFMMPVDSWSAGGKLFFAAKTVPDDDSTDSAAVIDKTFDDTVVTEETVGLITYKKYTLAFIGSDTQDVSFADGSKRKKYLGEFQFVPSGGQPVSFPGDDSFIEVLVYADIKRKVV